jgi:hypothetical protein
LVDCDGAALVADAGDDGQVEPHIINEKREGSDADIGSGGGAGDVYYANLGIQNT